MKKKGGGGKKEIQKKYIDHTPPETGVYDKKILSYPKKS